MNEYLSNSQLYAREYNCSAFNASQIPLHRRQNIPVGVCYICVGVFCEVLYIPCMLAIRRHIDSTCYKFMFFIAVADMCCLLMNAILTGYLSCIGATFCTWPDWIYMAGSYGLLLWACETMAEMMLAFNRCVLVCSARLAERLFGGTRVYAWMGAASLYGLFFGLCTRPVIFSGLYSSWFFNPHMGYPNGNNGDDFSNTFHTVHNYLVICVLSGIYVTLALIVTKKRSQLNKASGAVEQNSMQRKVVLQVLLISLINAVAASIYVYMQNTQLNEMLIILGQFVWILAHGGAIKNCIPPLIYLTINRTVRRDVLKMLTARLLFSSSVQEGPPSAGGGEQREPQRLFHRVAVAQKAIRQMAK